MDWLDHCRHNCHWYQGMFAAGPGAFTVAKLGLYIKYEYDGGPGGVLEPWEPVWIAE